MAKSKAQFRRPSASEQLVLEHFQVHLLTAPDELARCDALIVEHHYLRNATLVGEHLRYAATYKGEWLALVTFSAAAYHLRYRDQFIGWSPEQRRRRLPLVVNNSRFLVLPSSIRSCFAAPRIKSAAGVNWGRLPASAATRRISIKRTSGPNNSG
jgi:hypothetical protein